MGGWLILEEHKLLTKYYERLSHLEWKHAACKVGVGCDCIMHSDLWICVKTWHHCISGIILKCIVGKFVAIKKSELVESVKMCYVTAHMPVIVCCGPLWTDTFIQERSVYRMVVLSPRHWSVWCHPDHGNVVL